MVNCSCQFELASKKNIFGAMGVESQRRYCLATKLYKFRVYKEETFHGHNMLHSFQYYPPWRSEWAHLLKRVCVSTNVINERIKLLFNNCHASLFILYFNRE